MTTQLSSVDITQRAYATLFTRRRELLPFAGALALAFLLVNLVRGLFPGLYIFNPFDLGWLLIPEALVFGPIVALLHHRLLDNGKDFAWSRDNRIVKLLKAAAYFYVLNVLTLIGPFIATQGIPALIGFLLGPSLGPLYPIIVGAGLIVFLMLYVRPSLCFAALADGQREAMIISLLLTKGKAYRMVSCLLLPAAPVLIPWVASAMYGGEWLEPNLGHGLRLLPILILTLMQTVGVLILSSGLCAAYTVLSAELGDDIQS